MISCTHSFKFDRVIVLASLSLNKDSSSSTSCGIKTWRVDLWEHTRTPAKEARANIANTPKSGKAHAGTMLDSVFGIFAGCTSDTSLASYLRGGASVVGDSAVGASVVGATVVGAAVVGASLVDASVVSGSVVGAAVTGTSVVDAGVGTVSQGLEGVGAGTGTGTGTTGAQGLAGVGAGTGTGTGTTGAQGLAGAGAGTGTGTGTTGAQGLPSVGAGVGAGVGGGTYGVVVTVVGM